MERRMRKGYDDEMFLAQAEDFENDFDWLKEEEGEN